MSSKRATARAMAPSASTPMFNLLALLIALSYGVWLLVARGRLSWPPTELLASATTIAGALALAGPIVLSRREAGDGGLGDMLWMTGGVLVWVFDAAGVLQGGARYTSSWVAPLGPRAMGLTMLAVVLAGWRLRAAANGRGWSWTNVTGWVLGLFWVGMALASFLPGRTTGLGTP